MTDTVLVEGAKELARTLKKAGVDVKELKEANNRVGQVIVQAAQSRAPKKSGRLAGSIRASKEQAGITIRAGNNGGIPYAAPIHWGWPKRNIKATLFLTNAIAETQPEWIDLYYKELEHIVSEIRGV